MNHPQHQPHAYLHSISHRRILNWGFWFAGLTGATPQDRLCDCLPLFHSVGGIVAPCSMLAAEAKSHSMKSI